MRIDTAKDLSMLHGLKKNIFFWKHVVFTIHQMNSFEIQILIIFI